MKLERIDGLLSLDAHTHPGMNKNLDLENLVNYCIGNKLDVLGIISYQGNKYKDFFMERYNLPKVYKFKYIDDVSFEVSLGYNRVVFIKGQEIKTQEGHLLAFGNKKNVEWWLPLRKAVDKVKEQNAILIADHPFLETAYDKLKKKRGMYPHLQGILMENLLGYQEHIDCIEWNAQNTRVLPDLLDLRYANQQAVKFSKENDFPLIATSDAHFDDFGQTRRGLEQLGLGHVLFRETEFDRKKPVESIQKIIQNKRFWARGKYISRKEFLRWNLGVYAKWHM